MIRLRLFLACVAISQLLVLLLAPEAFERWRYALNYYGAHAELYGWSRQEYLWSLARDALAMVPLFAIAGIPLLAGWLLWPRD
jgi:hypothetical protein